ncbi:hypothetical protein [Corynebacterium comes]|uniref:hypothetical protein n=1 Tax=Corynebacterium comes TaxID=2675218 RepID=UPI0012E18AF9|nr:hypothetical protein [Corynebacterium comes]
MEQVEWLSGALAASYQALTGQNAFVARGMDIADEGGAVGADAVSFPARPHPRFENFSFMPPMVVPALSIEQLSADFSATRIAECVAASRLWHSLSAETAAIAQSLDAVAQDLSGSNRGEVIEAAIDKIAQVARAGETFAQNSQIMGSSVERLSAIKQDGALKVNFTRAALAAIVDPVQRTAAEQSFLQSFPAMYMPSVATGIPPIRNLMVMDPTADGGGDIALGMNDVAGKGSKHDASGHRPAGAALEAVTSMQQAMGAGDFGTVQSGVDGLAGVNGGEFVQAGDLGTTTASTGTLPAPSPVGSMGAPSFGAGGAPTLGSGPVGSGPVVGGLGPMGGLGNVGNAVTTAAGAGRGPVSFGGGMPSAGVPGGVGAVGAARPGRVGGMGVGGAGGSGAVSRLSAGTPGTSLTGTSAGAGSGAGVATRMSAGTPVPAGTPVAGGTSVAAGTGAASRSTGVQSGRGMMPMMGAPMMGQGQSKSAKVRNVTSSVEEDDNVAALLGERPPVVPGVIGAWARG